MRTYEYLFYKLYCIWLKKKDEIAIAPYNAVIFLSFLMFFNIVSIPMLIMVIFGKGSIVIPNLPEKWVFLLILLAFIIYQYFLFLSDEKYLRIIERYKDESELQRKKGLIYTWLYVSISIGTPLYIFFFTTPK